MNPENIHSKSLYLKTGNYILNVLKKSIYIERSGSGVELRTLDYENTGSNPGCGIKENYIHDICIKLIVINDKINTLAKDDY